MGCTNVVIMTAITNESPVVEAEQHSLSVIDHTGDTKTIWNTGVQDEIDVAKETFTKLKKKGYLAYRVGRGGEKDEVLHRFDPEAGAIIMTPPLAGG